MSEEVVFEAGPRLLSMLDTRSHLSVITMMLKRPMKINGIDFWFQTALTSKKEGEDAEIILHVPHMLALTAVKFHEGLLSMLDLGVEMGVEKGVEKAKPVISEINEKLRFSTDSNAKALNAIEALHHANSDLKGLNASLQKRINELEAKLEEATSPKGKSKKTAAKVEPEAPEPTVKKKGLGTSRKKI